MLVSGSSPEAPMPQYQRRQAPPPQIATGQARPEPAQSVQPHGPLPAPDAGSETPHLALAAAALPNQVVASPRERHIVGFGGWHYRQDADGTIRCLGKDGDRVVWTAKPGEKFWDAANNEIVAQCGPLVAEQEEPEAAAEQVADDLVDSTEDWSWMDWLPDLGDVVEDGTALASAVTDRVVEEVDEWIDWFWGETVEAADAEEVELPAEEVPDPAPPVSSGIPTVAYTGFHQNKRYAKDHHELGPDEVATEADLLFHPSWTSCLKASGATLRTTGAELMGAPYDRNHLQLFLQGDVHRDKGAGQVMKSNEELGAERAARIAENVSAASAVLDRELAAGHGIVVGVCYTSKKGSGRHSNPDMLTDHWVIVVGKESGGYVFFDVGTGREGGPLAPDAAHGGVLTDGKYTLTMVRLNATEDAESLAQARGSNQRAAHDAVVARFERGQSVDQVWEALADRAEFGFAARQVFTRKELQALRAEHAPAG